MRSNPWFAALSDRFQQDVVARASMRFIDKGTRLFSRGDPGCVWYGLLEGAIQIGGTSSAGRAAVLTFYLPGAWFGEPSLLDGGPRMYDASAHIAAQLLVVGAADFEELLSRHPEFSRSLLKLECERLRVMAIAMEATATHSPEQRLAGRLVEMARSYGSPTERGHRIDLNLPQETLAQVVGISRQRVNQIFKLWSQEGLIEQHYGHLVLLDQTKLEAMAQGAL
ncbi:MAG: Crp/Fnr family transcriptional regulator [Burkholderiaceae bacterium]